MEKINEITIPKGVDRIAVKQHEDKIVIEFIPKEAKFKRGDEVMIKKEISSVTHRRLFPCFELEMDDYIGKKLIIENALRHPNGAYLYGVDESMYRFLEDWFEPYVEELKKGDLAIFWDNYRRNTLIRLYDTKSRNIHIDNDGTAWDNAVKWDGTKEKFEKVLRREIN